MNNVLNFIKTHQVAAQVFRMVIFSFISKLNVLCFYLKLFYQVLALPQLPEVRNNPLCPNFCMLDGYNAIVQYAREFSEILMVVEGFFYCLKYCLYTLCFIMCIDSSFCIYISERITLNLFIDCFLIFIIYSIYSVYYFHIHIFFCFLLLIFNLMTWD